MLCTYTYPTIIFMSLHYENPMKIFSSHFRHCFIFFKEDVADVILKHNCEPTGKG